MIYSADLFIQQAVALDHLLSCFDTHLHKRHQHAAVREEHLSLSDQEPFSGTPLLHFTIATLTVRHVETALHTNYWLVIFTHGELFQVIVGLEQYFSGKSGC